ncbi:hypothetical protein CEXT_516761 [Caerostris extrusa]|uniref:Uncharacterized protein n=1 Tax=Caerostris extrusa TaxID=172846 RepID=A0AAV4V0Z5_CAEEX|nr:hypothetical protein CEXT_516761 [Caerostris extrusa]
MEKEVPNPLHLTLTATRGRGREEMKDPLDLILAVTRGRGKRGAKPSRSYPCGDLIRWERRCHPEDVASRGRGKRGALSSAL